MTALQIAIVIALTGQAVFQQIRVSDVAGNGHLRLAIIHAAAGVIAGGFSAPAGVTAAADGPAGSSPGGGPDD
jgi:hypothetical protein